MNKRQRAVLKSLVEFQQYLETCSALREAVLRSWAMEELTEFIGQVQEYSDDARRSREAAKQATSMLRDAVRTLRESHMRPIAQIAAVHLADRPEAAALELPRAGVPRHELVLAGYTMVDAVERWADTFVIEGLEPDFQDKLMAAVNGVDNLEIARDRQLRAAVGATRAIGPALKRGLEARRTLDALVGRVVADNAYQRSIWEATKVIRADVA